MAICTPRRRKRSFHWPSHLNNPFSVPGVLTCDAPRIVHPCQTPCSPIVHKIINRITKIIDTGYDESVDRITCRFVLVCCRVTIFKTSPDSSYPTPPHANTLTRVSSGRASQWTRRGPQRTMRRKVLWVQPPPSAPTAPTARYPQTCCPEEGAAGGWKFLEHRCLPATMDLDSAGEIPETSPPFPPPHVPRPPRLPPCRPCVLCPRRRR